MQPQSETRGEAHEYYRTLGPTRQDEAIGAINELVQDLGEQAVIEGVHGSVIASRIGQASASQEAQAVAVNILAPIIDSANPRKTADVMALACGLLLRQGATMTDVALKYGVTKADISKEAVEFCERLGLPPSHVMLPEAARHKYQLSNKRNYQGRP